MFGEGIQNYMNDSPVDIGIENNLSDPVQADPRQADPDRRGLVLFVDHTWNEKFSSAIGYSCQDNDNTDAQAPDAFRIGQYALGNLLYYPVPNVMVGGELQWGRRENFSDGFRATASSCSSRSNTTSRTSSEDSDDSTQEARFDRRMCTLAARSCWRSPRLPSTRRRPGDVQKAVDAAYAKYQDLKEGKNADYIPALAKVDPNLFGIAVVTADGKVYTAGDVKTEVSIQSISKVFTMAQVIQEQGLDSIEKRIGVDATGARFNSIIAVEGVKTVVGTGAPEMNPLVNPGAISATSMVTGSDVGRGVEEDHRLPQRRGRPRADRAAGRLQVRVRHQPAQPGDRRADARLRLHQGQLAAGGRSLHAPVLDRRERHGPGDDGGDAGLRRHQPGHREDGHGRRQGARASSP